MKKIAKRTLISFIIFSVLIGIFYGGLYIYAIITPKMNIKEVNSYYLYDNKGELIFDDKDWIDLDNISPYLVNATLGIEDKNFYKHDGFDYLRIIKALYTNIVSGSKKEGASTITQQYARNLFLNFEKTYDRKIEEALLAFELETHYGKDEILEGYLNTINYGGVFGIENASKYYFGKSASYLNLAEAAMLVGIPKSPSNYSPFVNEKIANERQHYILNSLFKNKIISEEEYNIAKNTTLVYVSKEEKNNLSSLLYFKDAVIDELEKIDSIPKSLLATGGIKIYTTLDVEAQKLVENTTDDVMSKEGELQTALVMMDPNTGKIIALNGGVNYYESQFNRATSSKRQVGSTIKPFLYYAALENGFTLSSTFTSEKTVFTFSNDKTYTPQNYNDKYPNAPISMGAAIAYSDNIYAVKTHLFLGEDVLVDMARRVGINSNLSAVPSLALGSAEISMYDMLTGYSCFANGGYKIKPHLIEKIEDSNGNVLYQFNEVKEGVLNKSLVFLMNELLTFTYDSNFIDYNYPTLINLLPEVTNKYSIKTGTTDTDMWIFGYNKNIITAVWNGYDDNRKITSDDYPFHKAIWIKVMEDYLKNKDNSWYEMPNNVVGIMVNPITGKIVDSYDKKAKIFYYIKGTEPYYESADLDKVFKEE